MASILSAQDSIDELIEKHIQLAQSNIKDKEFIRGIQNIGIVRGLLMALKYIATKEEYRTIRADRISQTAMLENKLIEQFIQA